MIAALTRLASRARKTDLAQVARFIELAARARGSGRTSGGVGGDTPLNEEPLRFVASDRMSIPTGDVADIQLDGDGQARVVTNLLGMVGATPALPAFYSEVQLQRRRLRDRSMATFYNIFDHRVLSFFYRISRKYRWLIGYERDAQGMRDPISDALLSYAGLASGGTRDRLEFSDALLAPLAGQLGDMRRSAGALESALRHVTGLELRVIEAEPTWMPLPPEEQTRIGGPAFARFARLGGEQGMTLASEPDAAVIGAAVLDAQHHYVLEIGPLSHGALLGFATGGAMLRRVRDTCRIAAGIEQRPILRLRIAKADVPPLQLGNPAAPAHLARTTWLGSLAAREAVLADCMIPIAAVA